MLHMVARHLEIIFFFLISPKCDLGEVEKAMLQLLACHFELIFGPFTIPKCDVEKALFQGPAWQFQPILSLWTIPKFDWGEVNKAIFLEVARHCDLIFCLLTIP